MLSQFDEMSEILKAMAHPMRLKILVGLKKDGCNVTEIQKNLGLPQSTISQHLRILKQVKIIKGRREGTKICYTVINDWAKQIIEMAMKELFF